MRAATYSTELGVAGEKKTVPMGHKGSPGGISLCPLPPPHPHNNLDSLLKGMYIS